MVDTQMRLLDHLGIEKLHATTGGSTGGVMALSLATRYPDRVDIVIPVAAGVRTTALQTISNFEQINAIQNDGHFASGDYYAGPGPEGGLALARMIGHKYFVSLSALAQRVRDEVISEEGSAGMYRLNSQLESYMRHQGDKFVMRFDANTYLRVMHAWNTYDLVREAGRDDFHDLFVNSKRHRYLVFSIDSDVCFYSEEQEELVEHLDLAGVPNRWVTVHSDKGHDAFLLEPQLFYSSLVDTLTSDG
jgi:homoserine O-acetyltransferase